MHLYVCVHLLHLGGHLRDSFSGVRRQTDRQTDRCACNRQMTGSKESRVGGTDCYVIPQIKLQRCCDWMFVPLNQETFNCTRCYETHNTQYGPLDLMIMIVHVSNNESITK